MFETMYDAPGIGLAAIQVGVPLRVLVIDLQPDDPDAEPEVACDHGGHDHHHQPTSANRGCSSIPKFSIRRKSFRSIPKAASRSPKSTPTSNARPHPRPLAGSGRQGPRRGHGRPLATCLQHEMDHLEGILFIDHLSRLKRQMALKKLEKLRKAA
jgi:peptide deformylase